MAGSEGSGRDLWRAEVSAAPRVRLTGSIWRVVESQEQIATRALVDTLEEQDLLERLVEAAKPPLRTGTEHLDYLLATPFRYPPLRWGSRFGTAHEPSIFYGSRRRDTALAEVAYYRFLFWHGMRIPPRSGVLVTQHTAFSARIDCNPGFRLQDAPFDTHREDLVHRSDHRATQALGAAMRAAGIVGFEAPSARCPQRGLNVGVFSPHGIASRVAGRKASWLCELTSEQVVFRGDRLVKFTPASVSGPGPS